jgi:hypothetical protein
VRSMPRMSIPIRIDSAQTASAISFSESSLCVSSSRVARESAARAALLANHAKAITPVMTRPTINTSHSDTRNEPA